MDKKALLKLADYIAKVPVHGFNMKSWSEVVEDEVLGQKHIDNELKCGMTACLGGWAVIVFPKRLKMMKGGVLEYRYAFIEDVKTDAREAAAFAKAFDICERCANILTDSTALHDTPKKAVNALRRFVKKGEIREHVGTHKINPRYCKFGDYHCMTKET